MLFKFGRVTKRTGKITRFEVFEVRTPTDESERRIFEANFRRLIPETILESKADQGIWYLALLPPDFPWVMVSATWRVIDGTTGSGGALTPFKAAPPLVHKLFDVDGPIVARHLLAGLPKGAQVRIRVEIDTDHPAFTALAKVPAALGIVVKSAIHVGGVKKPGLLPSPLPITIEAVNETADYGGCVALDLGNTGSTLVRRDGINGTDTAIHLVDLESPYDNPDPKASPSALWLGDYGDGPDAASTYAEAKYEIGQAAIGPDRPPQEVFFGAKRLLSDRATPKDDGTIAVELGGKSRSFPRSVPAELFIARMLQAFSRKQKSFPIKLTLTCPTTFNRSEAEELKRAAYHAYRRARGDTQRHEPSQDEIDSVVWRVIDEASAAAFYFVYKDFLSRDVPGRIPGFRYLYPDGMTLLLYDCGGGTTDLALVRVNAPANNRIEFRVLGRAGHRMFGGDAMTIAVYRVLKAKIVQKLKLTNQIPSEKSVAAIWTEDTLVRKLDEAYPTAFGGEQVTELTEEKRADRDLRRARTGRLWRLAEIVKTRIASTEPAKSVQVWIDGDKDSVLTDILKDLNFANNDKLNDLKTIEVSRKDVDPLLNKDIRDTVRYARSLIQKRLDKGREVDCVYIVGNASRYRLVKETLADKEYGLPVRFLSQRIRHVDEDDLKNSVAKGALTAMRVSLIHDDDFSVEFDPDLMDRLCFDIRRVGIDVATDKTLFRENTPYSELGSRQISTASAKGRTNDNSGLTIRRAWPGDSGDEPYLSFDLGRSAASRYEISYPEISELKGRRRFALRECDSEGNPSGDYILGYSAEGGLRNSPVEVGEKQWPKATLLTEKSTSR